MAMTESLYSRIPALAPKKHPSSQQYTRQSDAPPAGRGAMEENSRNSPARHGPVLVPADWLHGFRRAGYRPLDAVPADPVALFLAFDQVDERGVPIEAA